MHGVKLERLLVGRRLCRCRTLLHPVLQAVPSPVEVGGAPSRRPTCILRRPRTCKYSRSSSCTSSSCSSASAPPPSSPPASARTSAPPAASLMLNLLKIWHPRGTGTLLSAEPSLTQARAVLRTPAPTAIPTTTMRRGKIPPWAPWSSMPPERTRVKRVGCCHHAARASPHSGGFATLCSVGCA